MTSRPTARRARETTSDHDPLAWIADLPPTITRDAAAKYAGCSTRHIDRAIADGELVALVHGANKFRRRVVILRDSFGRWLRTALEKAKR